MIDRTEQDIMKNWKQDKESPVVSICTISYNHEKYISKALDSFLMQKTDFPFEVLISDDCSTDKTQSIIKKYQEKFPKIIKAHLRSKNVGMQINGSENLKSAKGFFIALCDGDDFWLNKDKLQIQIDAMQEHEQCDISFHPSRVLISETFGDVVAQYSEKNKVFSSSEIILGNGDFCPTASLVMKNDVVKALPDWFYDKAPVGDYFLQVFGALNGGALFLHPVMASYRMNVGVSWSSSMKDREKKIIFLKKYIKALIYLYNDLADKHGKEINIVILRYYRELIFAYREDENYHEMKVCHAEYSQNHQYQKVKFKVFYLFVKHLTYNKYIRYFDICLFECPRFLFKMLPKKIIKYVTNKS